MEEFSLTSREIEKILAFEGYGRFSAPVWFIGIEEGLGLMDGGDAEQNLRVRGTFERVMDLRDAHLRLYEGGCHIDFKKKESFTQVWQYMAKVMLARNGDADWKQSGAVKKYIRRRLGRRDGDTFLTELSPIPSANSKNKGWYAWFKERVPSGLDQKIEQRQQQMARNLKEQIAIHHLPSLIVCYGRSRAQQFAQMLNITWEAGSDHSAVFYASSGDARLLLLPFFGNGRMSHQLIADLAASGLLSE